MAKASKQSAKLKPEKEESLYIIKDGYEWPNKKRYPRYYAKQRGVLWFVLQVHGDVEPELHRACQTQYAMEKKARQLKEEVGDHDGIYWVKKKNGRLTVGAFCGGFFQKEEKVDNG